MAVKRSPPYVSEDRLRGFIKSRYTNEEALIDAFQWGTTPQGGNYWYSIYCKRRNVTEEDKEYLHGLLGEEYTGITYPEDGNWV